MKNLKDIKTINIQLNLRTVVLLSILILVGAVGFSYREMSSLRRDLYNVRSDYYGLNNTFENADNYIVENSFENTLIPNFDIVSQKVTDMNINDDDATAAQAQGPGEDWKQLYKSAKVRVVEVLITNDTQATYSYSDNIGYLDENGVVQHTVYVAPGENQNSFQKNGRGLELASGGKATLYLYFIDSGKDISALFNPTGMY